MAGHRKARAQLIQRLQDFQPPGGGFGELLVGRSGKIGISPRLGAADAAPDLIKLGKPEHVGALHDHGVGGGNVEAGFHDVGGNQHVDLALIESGHHIFQDMGVHLAMRHRRLYFRHRRLQEGVGLSQIGDARRNKEALSAAIMLAQQGLAHHQRIERRHEGAHRQPVDGRGGDQRKVAHARQGQLQSARDGRGGEGQDMDVGLEAF